MGACKVFFCREEAGLYALYYHDDDAVPGDDAVGIPCA